MVQEISGQEEDKVAFKFTPIIGAWPDPEQLSERAAAASWTSGRKALLADGPPGTHSVPCRQCPAGKAAREGRYDMSRSGRHPYMSVETRLHYRRGENRVAAACTTPSLTSSTYASADCPMTGWPSSTDSTAEARCLGLNGRTLPHSLVRRLLPRLITKGKRASSSEPVADYEI